MLWFIFFTKILCTKAGLAPRWGRSVEAGRSSFSRPGGKRGHKAQLWRRHDSIAAPRGARERPCSGATAWRSEKKSTRFVCFGTAELRWMTLFRYLIFNLEIWFLSLLEILTRLGRMTNSLSYLISVKMAERSEASRQNIFKLDFWREALLFAFSLVWKFHVKFVWCKYELGHFWAVAG